VALLVAKDFQRGEFIHPQAAQFSELHQGPAFTEGAETVGDVEWLADGGGRLGGLARSEIHRAFLAEISPCDSAATERKVARRMNQRIRRKRTVNGTGLKIGDGPFIGVANKLGGRLDSKRIVSNLKNGWRRTHWLSPAWCAGRRSARR